jgi:hypothetical protein
VRSKRSISGSADELRARNVGSGRHRIYVATIGRPQLHPTARPPWTDRTLTSPQRCLNCRSGHSDSTRIESNCATAFNCGLSFGLSLALKVSESETGAHRMKYGANNTDAQVRVENTLLIGLPTVSRKTILYWRSSHPDLQPNSMLEIAAIRTTQPYGNLKGGSIAALLFPVSLWSGIEPRRVRRIVAPNM